MNRQVVIWQKEPHEEVYLFPFRKKNPPARQKKNPARKITPGTKKDPHELEKKTFDKQIRMNSAVL